MFFFLSAMPTKHEDDWGVATPENIRQSDKQICVSGEGFIGQYTPLFTSKLEEKLLDEWVIEFGNFTMLIPFFSHWFNEE